MKIKKGDNVKIIKGKDVGKTAKVLRVLPSENKVVVESVNVYKKHIKGDGRNRESAIVDIVKPIQASNVMVVCENCNKPVRISYAIAKSGKKTRICKACGKPIEKIEKASETKVKKDSKKTETKESKKKSSKSKSTK